MNNRQKKQIEKAKYNLKMNKRGQVFGLIIFAFIMVSILILGVIVGFGGAIGTYTLDIVVPELTNLGVVGDANLTAIAEVTITPMNNLVQNITWFSGVLFVISLIASIGLAMSFRITGNKWLMGFYFILMIMLILASILISNIYEDFYSGTNELALQLQSFVLLSFMIINAPMIYTIIGFITGIIMFSGMGDDFV